MQAASMHKRGTVALCHKAAPGQATKIRIACRSQQCCRALTPAPSSCPSAPRTPGLHWPHLSALLTQLPAASRPCHPLPTPPSWTPLQLPGSQTQTHWPAVWTSQYAPCLTRPPGCVTPPGWSTCCRHLPPPGSSRQAALPALAAAAALPLLHLQQRQPLPPYPAASRVAAPPCSPPCNAPAVVSVPPAPPAPKPAGRRRPAAPSAAAPQAAGAPSMSPSARTR
mmetsp:Transcript_10536/g.22650  ORF Transcript_10536/g.22650 Transcript_10536/m.22650 type:complete len:224 (-) Transcript_10536:57-728(-)